MPGGHLTGAVFLLPTTSFTCRPWKERPSLDGSRARSLWEGPGRSGLGGSGGWGPGLWDWCIACFQGEYPSKSPCGRKHT